MLLYLVKHLLPDLANCVTELTKILDGSTAAYWKAMIRVIKFVFDTTMYSLKMSPSMKKLQLEGVSDIEFTGYRDNRTSLYGYITYFCGAPISWKSKSGKSVTPSSTEAEYFASSEATKELMFVFNLLKGMHEEKFLNLLIILRVDNTGAIYIAYNHTTSPRTNFIDIRAHYVREIIDKGAIKILFIKSEHNEADIYTKHLGEDLFVKHASKNTDDLYNQEEQGQIVMEGMNYYE
jgi:hypothetical protein